MLVDHFPGYKAKSNTYNALLCQSLEALGVTIREYDPLTTLKEGAADVVHVHWPEYSLSEKRPLWRQLRLLKFWSGIRYARMRGAKIVWTAHNLRPHERLDDGLETRFYRKWIHCISGVICLSEASKGPLVERYPDLGQTPIFVIPHGDYRPTLGGTVTRDAARQALGLPTDALMIGSVGAVRRYKNLPVLIESFRRVAPEGVRLLIAGKSSEPELIAEIEQAISGDPRVTFLNKFLSDEEMEQVNVACDLMVFPYTDILNSGSALFSLSCSRAVVVPRLGSMPELSAAAGAEWVRLYEPPFSDEALGAAIAQELPAAGSQPDLSKFDWKVIGAQTKAAYEQVCR
ncbi:MAG: glycosyltransferase family 4 protein [Chthonomonas sp.]|nr:glycosyltransferase family 4 protein [Chthonomonas sp.]